jgi:hypothetical protein
MYEAFTNESHLLNIADQSLNESQLFCQIDRGVVSPADISMDITKLIHTLELSPTSFKEGVRLTLDSESHSHMLP